MSPGKHIIYQFIFLFFMHHTCFAYATVLKEIPKITCSNVSSYVLVEYIGKDLNKLSALGENSHTLNFRHVAHVFIRRNPMLL